MEKSFKALMLSGLMFLFLVPVFSLDGKGSNHGSGKDSINYLRTLSFYREFFKIELYEHAIGPWRDLFYYYPESSEKLYLDGASMYRSFIEASPEGPERDSYIDTLMLIYDQRMEYFGGAGNVLGRKGSDLFSYGRNNVPQVQEAYLILKRSIEIEGKDSRALVMLNFLSAGATLHRNGKLDADQVIEDYLTLAGILDQLEAGSSRPVKTRESIDRIMLTEDLLTCEALTRYFTPQFELKKQDKTFLERIASLYAASGCLHSEIYLSAAENLYKMAPGPEAAHKLAMLCISRGDYSKAIQYLQMAVFGEHIENETRAEWFYKLAIVSSANGEYCEAIAYAREALAIKKDLGKAYMALGDAIVASRSSLEDDFDQSAAFWAASDKYERAAGADPSLAAEAKQKLEASKGQYPDKEDLFFRDMKEGDPFRVKGCINDNTTVRSR